MIYVYCNHLFIYYALLLEGILEYAFGGVSEPDTVSKANAFLKLFLMAPRLVLHSTRGVARRARLLLSGSVDAFEELIVVYSERK